MKSTDLEDANKIKSEAARLFKVIDAPIALLPPFNSWTEGYHIEVRGGVYSLVFVERGQERKRIIAVDIDDLLYHLFSQVTWHVAYNSSLQRLPSQRPPSDLRTVYFPEQVKLLARLSREWGSRRQKEIDQLLVRHPYKVEI